MSFKEEKSLEIGIENFLFFNIYGARTTILTRDSTIIFCQLLLGLFFTGVNQVIFGQC